MNPQPETITEAVFERVEIEREQWKPQEEAEPGAQILTSEKILKSLNANEDGDAWLFIELHRGRFCFDHSGGQGPQLKPPMKRVFNVYLNREITERCPTCEIPVPFDRCVLCGHNTHAKSEHAKKTQRHRNRLENKYDRRNQT